MVSRREFLKTSAVGSGLAVGGFVGTVRGQDGPIKIGFNAPLTGFASADGQSAEQGAKLAVQLLNENGGVNGQQVDLLLEDDAAEADQAVPVAKDFITNERVDVGISGSYSTPTRAIAPIYDQAGIPFLSAYATHPDITEGQYTYRIGIWAPLHGKIGAKLADEDLGAETAALFILDNDFGQTISDQFRASAEERGLDLVYETKYPLGESDFRSILSNVKNQNPDVLYATGYYHEAANIVKQAAELGVESQIIGEEGYDSPMFFELGGEATNGTIISTNLNRGSDREATRTFLEAYRNEWDIRADMVAANSYDAVQAAGKAIQEAGSTEPDAVVEALSNLQDWDGAATGPIMEFIGPGEAVRPIAIQQVKEMEWTEYAVIDDPSLIRPDI